MIYFLYNEKYDFFLEKFLNHKIIFVINKWTHFTYFPLFYEK